ncbi:MAG: hypothetical protein L3J09_12845 [Flavobacteriaceae bacterium]|nr:hypothetical protein [Flavobacteriaceae bacterium]
MKNIILILFAFCLLISCNKDDDCFEYSEGGFISVNAPATIIGTINEDITIVAEFGVVDGCGSFSKFIESANGNTTTINLQVKYKACDAGCTLSAERITVDYIFNTGTPGDYVLKFKSNNDDPEFIIVNITIE